MKNMRRQRYKCGETDHRPLSGPARVVGSARRRGEFDRVRSGAQGALFGDGTRRHSRGHEGRHVIEGAPIAIAALAPIMDAQRVTLFLFDTLVSNACGPRSNRTQIWRRVGSSTKRR